MAALKNGQAREEDVYMGVRAEPTPPHLHIPTLRGIFFSTLIHINLTLVQSFIESHLRRVTKREPVGSLFRGMVAPINLPARYNQARFGRNRNSVECQG